ncbi:hypothetical protein ACN47E_001373 [Coniothyrium glycines]
MPSPTPSPSPSSAPRPALPLRTHVLHKALRDSPTPSLVLDRAVLRRNCAAMLSVCGALGVGLRAHVKSHKTLELSKMMVGRTGPADFVVSTVVEGEGLCEFVREVQRAGREGSILYGVPVPLSSVPRLIALAERLQPGTLHVIIDNEDAFAQFHAALVLSGKDVKIGVFIKIDTGYHRAGIAITSPRFPGLVGSVVEKSKEGKTFLKGFYSHFGHSYAGNSEEDAANGLIEELVGLAAAIAAMPGDREQQLVLSVGATPTATAAQNMLADTSSPKVKEFHDILGQLQKEHVVELHAGVYPLLDCQQIATHARPAYGQANPTFQPLSKENIAIKMLVEVTSVYDEREKPEALVSAGSLAMGREPCKSYPGWGIVSKAFGNKEAQSIYDERGDKTGWIVGRISQEHGILTWEGERTKCNPLTVGEKLLIWPNHACVTGAGFGWYLIIDSEKGQETVVDVWDRWGGW